MTDRDRLIELIKIAKKNTKGANSDIERNMLFAESLLANGVIVPPCKVGDKIYFIFGKQIFKSECVRIAIEPFTQIGMSFYCSGGFIFDNRNIGKTVFLTKEEAEAKLKDAK